MDGTVCSLPQEQLARWREHFLQVLNIPSTFSEDEIGQLRQRDIYHELAEPPQPCEIERAIRHLSNGKAAGKSGILPEMLKVNSEMSMNAFAGLLMQYGVTARSRRIG